MSFEHSKNRQQGNCVFLFSLSFPDVIMKKKVSLHAIRKDRPPSAKRRPRGERKRTDRNAFFLRVVSQIGVDYLSSVSSLLVIRQE